MIRLKIVNSKTDIKEYEFVYKQIEHQNCIKWYHDYMVVNMATSCAAKEHRVQKEEQPCLHL